MSTLEYNEKGFSFLRNVSLAYVKFIRPEKKYESNEEEYTLCAVMDKATHKEWKKVFKKNKCKEVDTADFKKQYLFDAPYPEQDEQYIYKFRVDKTFGKGWTDKKNGIEYAAGSDVPVSWLPTILKPNPDGTNEDITFKTEIQNGSKADIALTTKSNDFGTFVKLNAVLVTDLIEYEAAGGGGAFGAVVGGGTAKVEATKETPKQSQPEPEIDFDDTIPF